MQQPWVVTPAGLVAYQGPEQWLFEPRAWDQVEAYLGTRLPRDYKDLVADGLALIFDDGLVIASPFDPNPRLNLIRLAAGSAWTLASLSHGDPDSYPIGVYPEPGGLLGWGVDGGGGNYHWATNHPDPDEWNVCIEGRPLGSRIDRSGLGLTPYLDSLRNGASVAAMIQRWPGPQPTMVRRPVSDEP